MMTNLIITVLGEEFVIFNGGKCHCDRNAWQKLAVTKIYKLFTTKKQ